MKSTVEQLSPTRVKILVEVPFDELKPNFDRAYRKIAAQVRIPGFRPGKAPARILDQRLGRGVVLDEVVNEAVPAKYSEALAAGEVRPLGRPEIEVTEIADGDHLAFTAEVDVRPEIAVPPAEGISVTVDDVEVDEAEVDEQLEQLRARFGTLTGVERGVQDGDFVTLDLTATVDGEEVADAATSGLSYEVGSGQLVDGVDEAILGATAGETRTFTTTLVAGDHAGREAEVRVTVGSVKERELPEADDEFAQLASEFDTLDELRGDLRERLGRVKGMQKGAQARDRVLEALLEATEVPLPDAVVQAEYDQRRHDAVHAFDHDETRLGEWLQEEQGTSLEEFESELREGARDAVKTQLVLDAVADAQQVQINDQEVTERILYQAQRYGVSPDEYVKRAQEAGQLGAIFADVRRGKALAAVVRAATVTDPSGERVDVDALFGTSTPDAAESDATPVDGGDAEAEGTGGQTTADDVAVEEAAVESAADGGPDADAGDTPEETIARA